MEGLLPGGEGGGGPFSQGRDRIEEDLRYITKAMAPFFAGGIQATDNLLMGVAGWVGSIEVTQNVQRSRLLQSGGGVPGR